MTEGERLLNFFKRLVPLKAKVWLTLDKPAFQEGETVVGKVNIDSSEYIQGNEVRVEARVFEHFSEPVWVQVGNRKVQQMQRKKNTLFSRDVRVSGPTDLGNGSRSFPFSVNIPPYRPTRYGASVENSVKGVLAVKGRPDAVGQVQIGFAPPGSMPVMMPTSAPSNPGFGIPTQQATQVITREVVKVHCRYCDALMDISANRCPNCSAPQ